MTTPNGKGRNWRARYLTKDEFAQFRDNHFKHLVNDVKWLKLLLVVILAAVIGSADQVSAALIKLFIG